MRNILATVVLVCAAALSLSACNQQDKSQQAQVQAPAAAVKPTDPADKAGWKKYLQETVLANMQGVKTTHPYMYYIPAGDDDTAKTDRQNQLENVRNVVARGVLPGNMMAFGGPDSKITADFVVEAFKDAQAGTFKDVVVLFIGAPADADAVKQGLATSSADVRFVEAK